MNAEKRVPMGMIRKTASILTFGGINFRSKNELLERARGERDEAQAELETIATVKSAKKRADRKKARREAAEAAGSMTRRGRRKAKRELRKAAIKSEAAGRRVGRRAKRKAAQAIDAVTDLAE